MTRSIEEFKKELTDGRKDTISESVRKSWEILYNNSRQYGKKYEPKKGLFGYNCPNCSGILKEKYLGHTFSNLFGEYFEYYVFSCKCGYEYAKLDTSV